jgi:hypothetical protein
MSESLLQERMAIYVRLIDNSHKVESGCRIWDGQRNNRDYGKFYFQGTNSLAHRAMYFAYYGSLPEGLYVCHACDTPGCIEPAHLFVGTARDNSDDMIRKGRGREGRIALEVVRAMRQEFDAGGVRVADLARKYGMTRKPAHFIVHRQSYRNVE